MTKATINLLCLAGCAYLVLSTQSNANRAQRIADAAADRAAESERRAAEARRRAGVP